MFCGALLLAAQPPAAETKADPEQDALRRAVSEGSSSSVDLMRALEGHLAKYPDSPRKAEIQRALAKAAIENKDERRIALYGQAVLARDSSDLPMLDRVTRALLTLGDPAGNKQALEYAKRFEALLREVAQKPAPSAAENAKRKEDIDKAIARAVLSQAIATGNLGDTAAAAALARKSFETAPTVDAAAELGRRLAQSGKADEAIQAYADAFTLPDGNATEDERLNIRRRMGELYQKAHNSQAGLGDLVLQAYDRNAALLADHRDALRSMDPNMGITNPMRFTLTGVSGQKLPMFTLLGKAVVLDFWATWCGPCRAQHPLYEQVMKKFAQRDDVVFLAINTDEERESVMPFLEEQKWPQNRVYYEDGLSRALRVSSIPTTLVIGRDGAIVSRMNGYDPERFVDMLTERINDALK